LTFPASLFGAFAEQQSHGHLRLAVVEHQVLFVTRRGEKACHLALSNVTIQALMHELELFDVGIGLVYLPDCVVIELGSQDLQLTHLCIELVNHLLQTLAFVGHDVLLTVLIL